MGEATYTTYKV